jgi:hypothetical protein
MEKEKEAKTFVEKGAQESREKSQKCSHKKELWESKFPYDDAFRTLEGRCDDVLLPLINYWFHEEYDNTAVITRLRNEHYVENAGKRRAKKITDSHFRISFRGTTKDYQLECESSNYDRTLLIRMFEYHTQTAIDNAKEESDNLGKMTFRFPYAGLLLLRGKESDPEEVEIELVTPEGCLSYHVPIIRMMDFTIDDLFEKRLYFLIPFYIFNFEKDFPKLEKDERARRKLADRYTEILLKVDEEAQRGRLSQESRHAIIELTNGVVRSLTKKHPRVREEVGGVMGGEVLDLEVFKAFRNGKAEGKAELVSAIKDLQSGMTREQLLEKYDEKTVELAFSVN